MNADQTAWRSLNHSIHHFGWLPSTSIKQQASPRHCPCSTHTRQNQFPLTVWHYISFSFSRQTEGWWCPPHLRAWEDITSAVIVDSQQKVTLHKRLSAVINSLSQKGWSLTDTIKGPARSFNNLQWKPWRIQDKVRWTQRCDGGASYQGPHARHRIVFKASGAGT